MNKPAENIALPAEEAPLITGGQTFHSITEKIAGVVERKMPKLWLLAFGASFGASWFYRLSGMGGYRDMGIE